MCHIKGMNDKWWLKTKIVQWRGKVSLVGNGCGKVSLSNEDGFCSKLQSGDRISDS